jgi:hypothetical protein
MGLHWALFTARFVASAAHFAFKTSVLDIFNTDLIAHFETGLRLSTNGHDKPRPLVSKDLGQRSSISKLVSRVGQIRMADTRVVESNQTLQEI